MSQNNPESPSADLAESLNGTLGGWNEAMGLRFVRATSDEVVAEVEIGPVHKQPYGIVHGGVYAGLIETVASTGAALYALGRGQSTVGLENSTSFLRAVRGGKIRIVARPLVRGRRTQVWEATVTDEGGRAVASGRVRLLSLEDGASVAGEVVSMKTSGE
jgi:uncharacterized protein (TIGR00369 family)